LPPRGVAGNLPTMKTIAGSIFVLALVALLPACGTSGGLDSQTNLSAAAIPGVGPGLQTAGQIYDEVNASAGQLAFDIVEAPFRVLEGSLGLTPEEVRSAAALNGRYSPEERLARRREARGLPAPPEIRVARRQTSRRYAERYRPAGQSQGTTLGR
jgi:hypothetical protein